MSAPSDRSDSDGVRLARRAQMAYGRGQGGWYVVNSDTRIPVRGPFLHEIEARREAKRVGDLPPMDVVEVGECR